jgi:NADH-quinone oxidoreductase subunit N
MTSTLLAKLDLQVGASDLIGTAPLLWITGFGVAVLLIDLLLRDRSSKRALGWLSILGLGVGLILNTYTVPDGRLVFSDTFTVDLYTYYSNIVILISVIFTILSSIDHLSKSDMLQGEYYGLLLLATSGMMLMVGANDLIVFFLGFEIMSLAAYILVGWEKSSLVSGEGSLKYIVTGAFTSAVLIYGIILVMAAVNGFSFSDIGAFLSSENAYSDPLFLSGTALIAGSFTYKIAAIPFHMWAPDAYRGAPTPITGFVSTGVKAAAFLGFIRVLLEITGSGLGGLTSVLALIAGITVIGGNIAAIGYRDIKGMLAYSSIAHAGYLLIGVTALMSGNTPADSISQGSVLFYLVAYTVMNLGAFGSVIYVEKNRDETLTLSDFKGLVSSHPWVACAFGLFLLSLTGIPLTAGFAGKVFIFHSALQSGFIGLAVVGAIGTLISIYYYMRVVVMMFMREADEALELPFSPSLSLLLLIAAWGVIHLGISPFWLLDLANRSVTVFL